MSTRSADTVVFDGLCNLCARSVQFILRHEDGPRFEFSPVQSAAGQRVLLAHGLSSVEVASFVLVSEGRAYTRSAAAIRLARNLRGPWKLLRLLWIIPRPLRDWLYDLVARNRYKWFGKADACMMPTPEVRARFRHD